MPPRAPSSSCCCSPYPTWGLTVVLTRAQDIAPFWDALTTALSLAA
ncbi:hypothetical protein [Streptomyces sp. NPDC007206]